MNFWLGFFSELIDLGKGKNVKNIIPICRYFSLNGTCRNEKNCAFRHVVGIEKSPHHKPIDRRNSPPRNSPPKNLVSIL